MPKRFDDALFIVDPGACNPSGIAHTIADACKEAREEGKDVRTCPAICLMVYQLASLYGVERILDSDEYSALKDQCKEKR